MSLFYDASKLYVIKISKVTHVEYQTWTKPGRNYGYTLPEYYIAKMKEDKWTNDKYFNIISKNFTLSNDHNHVEPGDYFVTEFTPLFLMAKTKKRLSKKDVIALEQEINNKNKEQEKSQDITKC